MRTWLSSIRDAKGYTQKDVSSNCGISRSFYADIERGVRNPKPSTAQDIATFLGFDWTIFFAKNGRKTSQSKTA